MEYFIDHNELPKRELFPGISATIVHSEQITASRVSLDKGAILPEHSHPNEQWTHIISGELELKVGGETRILTPGMTAFIPSNVPHSGKASVACEVIDIFNPARTDLK